MIIPPKAIIATPTRDKAQRLLSFLTANGYKWGSIDIDTWDVYRVNTCFNLEPNGCVCYCDRDFYTNEIRDYDMGINDEYEDSWIPENSALRFISVDDFIALCSAEDDNSSVDISMLL